MSYIFYFWVPNLHSCWTTDDKTCVDPWTCVYSRCYVYSVYNTDQLNKYLSGNLLQIYFWSTVGEIWYQKQWEHNVPKIASSRYQVIPHGSWVMFDGKVTSCFHTVHSVLISVSKMSIVLGQGRKSEVQWCLMIITNPMTVSDTWFILICLVCMVAASTSDKEPRVCSSLGHSRDDCLN